jgi:hypothetical protein
MSGAPPLLHKRDGDTRVLPQVLPNALHLTKSMAEFRNEGARPVGVRVVGTVVIDTRRPSGDQPDAELAAPRPKRP